jgi:hypothetical protein
VICQFSQQLAVLNEAPLIFSYPNYPILDNIFSLAAVLHVHGLIHAEVTSSLLSLIFIFCPCLLSLTDSVQSLVRKDYVRLLLFFAYSNCVGKLLQSACVKTLAEHELERVYASIESESCTVVHSIEMQTHMIL